MDLKIKALSQNPPREWQSKFGTMLTYKVKFEGSDDIVDVNRKPGNEPKVGDVLQGTIEDSDFGKKLKPAPKQFGGGGKSFQPRDDAAIRAQWAVNAALQRAAMSKEPMSIDIESTAKEFFAMVDRIKASGPIDQEMVDKTFDKPKDF